MLKNAITVISAALLGLTLLTVGVGAQERTQTINLARVDVEILASGYRASRVIGRNVVNDDDETIGGLSDILVSADGMQPYAVLSIGGFLGTGPHLVVLPYETLVFGNDRVTLPGASRESLRMLPEFRYAAE